MGACDSKDGKKEIRHQEETAPPNKQQNQQKQLRDQAQRMGLSDVPLALDSGLQKKSIKKLKFDHQNLSELPKNLSYFSNLQRLYLAHNKFSSLQPISKIKSLIVLDMSFNQLRKIEKIEALVLLKQLKLNDNQIQRLQNLSTNISLEKIDLSNNNIRNIQGLNNLLSLRELLLNQNCISQLPHLQFLSGLKVLDISQNPIRGESIELQRKQLQANNVKVISPL